MAAIAKTAQTRKQLLERFVKSRPANPDIRDDEIIEEVRAVRYAR